MRSDSQNDESNANGNKSRKRRVSQSSYNQATKFEKVENVQRRQN